MNLKIVTSLLLIWSIMNACSVQDELNEKHGVLIEGNEQLGFLFEETGSRAATEQLAVGSEISFFSKGALVCEGDTLKYDGTEWKGHKKFFWETWDGKAEVHAYCPAVSSNAATLYDDNHGLRDIVYAEGSFASGSRISLQFTHLFPKVTFRLAETINETVEKIQFRVSKKVTAMDMHTTALTLQDNNDELISFDRSTDATYSLFVPFSESNIAIYVTVETNVGKREVSLAKNFEKGVSYKCNINDLAEKTPGIFTTNDFIDFITLYNGGTVEGRVLEDFYDKNKNVDGKRVFHLMNSLTFTSEELKNLKPINKFADVFDGMNNTLTDIVLSDLNFNTPSLFIENHGEIRNIRIDNMQLKISRNNSNPSILCGTNDGVIHDCMVCNSVIYYPDDLVESFAALFVSYNHEKGLIYNSAIENSSIISDKMMSGGFAITNSGTIRNSYVYQVDFRKGGNLCYENRGAMSLSYVYRNPKKDNVRSLCFSNWGIIDNCFRNSEYGNNINNKDEDKVEVVCYSYQSPGFGKVIMDKVQISSLSDALNYWVIHEKYSKLSIELAHWKQAADGHPVFVFY